jgi:ankyrin repeat protein
MDFEESFAACIRTGNTAGITALGVDRSFADEILVCDTPVPDISGKGTFPLVRRPRPVIYAILCHQLSVVEKLASLGVDLVSPLYNGWSPIHYAVAVRDWDIASFIISRVRSELESKTELQATPLHIAVTNNDLLTTVGLLDFGADPNFGNINGNTALHIAMVQGVLIVQALLAFGARTDVVNAQNAKPIDVAQRRGNAELVKFLNGIAKGKIPLPSRAEVTGVLNNKQSEENDESLAEELDLLSQRVSGIEEALATKS